MLAFVKLHVPPVVTSSKIRSTPLPGFVSTFSPGGTKFSDGNVVVVVVVDVVVVVSPEGRVVVVVAACTVVLVVEVVVVVVVIVSFINS